MTTLQRRRLYFWLGLLAVSALLFLLVPWKAIPVLLLLLGIILSGPLTTLYEYVITRPVQPPSPQPEEEYPSYTQGYQEVPYYQPPIHQEAPITTEDQPQAQYPKPQYR